MKKKIRKKKSKLKSINRVASGGIDWMCAASDTKLLKKQKKTEIHEIMGKW